MSVWKMILFEKKYQTFDRVFHHQMKHLEVRNKLQDSFLNCSLLLKRPGNLNLRMYAVNFV